MRVRLATLVALSVVSLGLPVSAATGTSTDATPNFTESSGCGVYGVRGPLSPTLALGERIYGPFADFYGRDYAQVSYSIRSWVEPSGRTFRVHLRSLDAYRQAGANVAAAGTWYQVNDGAGWSWRNVNGSHQMSQHAVGNAIDLNPRNNPYRSDGTLITDIPPAYVDAYRRAGMCWGGDWLTTKDTMHFSWRGPAAVGGNSTRLAPYPPLTAPASFTTPALDAAIAIPADAGAWALGDRRRDGADDLYAVRNVSGVKQVLVTGAVSRFGKIGIRRDSTSPAGGVDLFSDGDGDGRADLWRIDTSSGSIVAVMYPDSARFAGRARTYATGIPWTVDAEVGFALFDWADWIPDLFVIERSTGRVSVYSAASGFTVKIHESTLPLAPGTRQLILADRDVDGSPDIWMVDSSGVRIVNYDGTGYVSLSETIGTGIVPTADSQVLPGDWDGDGRVDLYVISGGRIRVYLGGTPDRPVSDLSDWFDPGGPMTFDAGPVCLSVCDSVGFVESSGYWNLARRFEWGASTTEFFYGNPGDTPFLGDWDGDGVETPGLYRRSDGYVYLRNSNTQGVADIRFFFGIPGDVPLVGDFDGDGRDTVSIYRPSEARFYIINRLGDGDRGLGQADFYFDFGNYGDRPFVGDFDGDGDDEVGLHRQSTGLVYFRNTLTTGIADSSFIYGDPGDVVMAGDWDGDGVDTVGLYRPSSGLWFIRLTNTQGVADHVIPYGISDVAVLPVAGKTRLGASASVAMAECAECTPGS